MKSISLVVMILFARVYASAQVAINSDNSAPGASAMLDVKSTSKGLLAPRMTTAQRNNIPAGKIESTPGFNTSFGYNALNANTSGIQNTAVGANSLSSGSGSYNTAIGTRALFMNTERSNLVAVRDSALYNNGIGTTSSWNAESNTAIGSKSL